MFANIGKEYGMRYSVQRAESADLDYIRYGKAKGGLVGLTLSFDRVAGWILSYHIGLCNNGVLVHG